MSETLYLVTGAAGFLGSHVCHQLLERGEKVRAFVLDGDPAIKYIPKEAEIVKGDLCDIDSLENFFKAPEGTETIVLHVASMVSVNPDFNQKYHPEMFRTQRVQKTCLRKFYRSDSGTSKGTEDQRGK